MPFSDLETMSLNDFIDRNKGNDQTLWFFQHIPKTAGSSFSVEIGRKRLPYSNICIDYEDETRSHEEKLSLAVKTFIDQSSGQRFASASGHLRKAHVDLIRAEYEDCRVVTFLRSPEARVVSDYRYQRTPMHPPYQAFLKAFPDLETFARAPVANNMMAKYLIGDIRDIDETEAIRRVAESFTFVGLLEMYPMSFNILFQLMGFNGMWPVEHQRKTPDSPETRVDLTPYVRELIASNNRLDLAIFEYARKVLLKRREEFQKGEGNVVEPSGKLGRGE